jgi:hypothetical protein
VVSHYCLVLLYDRPQDMDKDVVLMLDNCCIYNMPTSDFYK